MTTLTEVLPHAGGFLLSEGPGDISREEITMESGAAYKAAMVLMESTATGTGTAAAGAGNTGDGTMSAVVVSAEAEVGVYVLQATAATKFDVEDPNGVKIGVATAGTEFSKGGLTFTITAGGTPFVANDKFTITVTISALTYEEFDGTGEALGLLYADVDATSADTNGTGIMRIAEVMDDAVTWKSGVTATQKALAKDQLAGRNIVFRS